MLADADLDGTRLVGAKVCGANLRHALGQRRRVRWRHLWRRDTVAREVRAAAVWVAI